MKTTFIVVITFVISILKSLVIAVIWVASSSVNYSWITLFFALNHICCKSRHSCSNHVIPVLNRTIFALYCIIFVPCKKGDVKAFKLDQITIGTDWILRFQNGCNKVVMELRVVQFWSEIILILWKIYAYDFRQIALHSVQLSSVNSFSKIIWRMKFYFA